MKKKLCLLVAICCFSLVCFTACGNGGSGDNGTTTEDGTGTTNNATTEGNTGTTAGTTDDTTTADSDGDGVADAVDDAGDAIENGVDAVGDAVGNVADELTGQNNNNNAPTEAAQNGTGTENTKNGKSKTN